MTSVEVAGRSVTVALLGDSGPPVLLLHGWALGLRSYLAPARALAGAGFQVILPDQPGFGRSKDLPLAVRSFRGYARVAAALVAELGIEPPVKVAGHSFGGVVAVQMAHDHPSVVSELLLLDAVVGTTWRREGEIGGATSERPVADWVLQLLRELPLRRSAAVAARMVEDVTRNVLCHPMNVGMVAKLLLEADLMAELEELGRCGLFVAPVWARGDRVVPRAAFEAQCRAVGSPGTVVDGGHGWMLSAPEAFGAVAADLFGDGGRRGAPARR